MEQIREYILGIVLVSLICSLLSALVGSDGAVGACIKLLSGLVICITVLSPLLSGTIVLPLPELNGNSMDAVSAGIEHSAADMKEIIKDRTQAYIMEKANSLGVSVSVDIQLSEQSPYIPVGITVDGSTSPYARQILAGMISDDLGIPLEEQTWR